MGWQDDPVAEAMPWDKDPIVDAPKSDLKTQNPGEYDPASPEYQARYGAASGGSLENFTAAAGKFPVDLWQGLKQRLGQTDEQDTAAQRELDAPLMATKAGKAGYLTGGLLTSAPALAIPGANTVAGAGVVGAVTGALQPTVEGESVLANTALGGVLGAGGQKVANVVGGAVSRKVAERTAKSAADQAENAVRDATIQEVRKTGYVVPPSHANPTVANRLAESVAGKAQTQQSATVKNQRITNRLVRDEFGLRPDAPLKIETLSNIRTVAGSVYKDIKSTGDVVTDGQYLTELSDLTRAADEIAADFPDLNVAASEQIQSLQNGLLRDKFSANGALEVMKQLRKEASNNLKWNVEDPAKKALGLAQREAAGIVEEQVIRHLQSIGKADLAGKFDKARTTIAKTYSVQSALNDATGNVVATKLAAQLRKGKPLSGNLEKVAKFGTAFPKVSGEQLSSPGVSALDAIVGVAGGAAIHPAALAWPAARIGTREALLTNPMQNFLALPSYVPRTRSLRGLGAGAELLPAAGVVGPGYFGQQQSFERPGR